MSRVAVLVSLSLLVTTGCSLPASDLPGRAESARPEDPGVTLGHVIDVVQCDGYMLVDFPWGRTKLSVDNRELDRFRAGETVSFDRNLRPLRVIRPRT